MSKVAVQNIDEFVEGVFGCERFPTDAVIAAFRPSVELCTPTTATKLALKSIATRHQHFSVEIDERDKHLDKLVAGAAPTLVAI